MSVGFHPCQVLVVDKNVGNREVEEKMEEKTVGKRENMVLVWQLEEGIVVNLEIGKKGMVIPVAKTLVVRVDEEEDVVPIPPSMVLEEQDA